MKDYELYNERLSVEHRECWQGLCRTLPKVTIPEGWSIQVVPPFGGAMARFWLWRGEQRLSFYLDIFDRIGYMDEPYWEVYPCRGDVARAPIGELQALIDEAVSEADKGSK